MAVPHVIPQDGDVADSYRDERPEPHGRAGFSRAIDYGLLVLTTFKFTGASLRISHGPEPAPVHHRRPPTAVPVCTARGGVAWLVLIAFAMCAAGGS